MNVTALEVALLYKNRWQVELFCKWIKQRLKIKAFWGTTENAVCIQVYSAIIAYCMVSIVGKDWKIDRSTYKILQILGISLLDKTFFVTFVNLFESLPSKSKKNLFLVPDIYFDNEKTYFNFFVLFGFCPGS